MGKHIHLILILLLLSSNNLFSQGPTVATGFGIHEVTSGGILASQKLNGIVTDPITGDIFVAGTANTGYIVHPNFNLYKVTPAGVTTFIATYQIQHRELITMRWGPNNLIYLLDGSTVRTINPSTGALGTYSTNSPLNVSGGRHDLNFDANNNLIVSRESISEFYRITPPTGGVYLGNTVGRINSNHGDAFDIHPDGTFIVHPDCGAQNIYAVDPAGHVDGTNFTVAWRSTNNFNTIIPQSCVYSHGAIDPESGNIFSSTLGASNNTNQNRIVITDYQSKASSLFVDNGSGITDMTFGLSTDGTGCNSLFFLDHMLNAVFEVPMNNCCAPKPDPVQTLGGGSFCGSATVTATGGTGGTIYFQGTDANGTSTANPSTSEVVNASGTYYFRAYNPVSGCWSGLQGAVVEILPVPADPVISPSEEIEICAGEDVTLSIPQPDPFPTTTYDIKLADLSMNLTSTCHGRFGSGNVGFSWNDIGSGIATNVELKFSIGVECQSSPTSVHTSTLNGFPGVGFNTSYWCSCGSRTTPEIITINLNNTDYDVGGVNTFLTNASTFGFVEAASLGNNFAQIVVTYGPPPIVWSPGGETTNSITVSPTVTTTYEVTVIGGGGCTATSMKTVTVSGYNLTARCQDFSVQLDASGSATITAEDIDNGSSVDCGDISLSASQTSFDCDDVSQLPDPSASMIITGVIDGPLTGGTPKAIEVYVLEDIADLSMYGLGVANNGGGTDGEEHTFPAVSASAGEYIYLATEAVKFQDYFGFAPDYTNGSDFNVNGDDAIELFFNGTVIDVFGDINNSGTGEPWEYLDGWAYRNSNTGPDGSTFNVANWTFSGKDALDGETTNITATSKMPIYTYGYGVVPVTLIVTDDNGNIATCIANVTVADNEAPTFTRPADITIYTDEDCKYDITVDNVGDVENEKDNCSTGIEATFVDAEPVAIEGCEGGFTIARTWSLKDNCGNSAEDQIQTITIRDNTVPTFTRPADITIYTDEDCKYDITVDNVGDVENEKDNCSTGIEATFVDAEPVAIEGCEGGFTIARTWSLKDNCGNSAEDQIQTITIRDNTVPTFTRPADITIYTDEDCKYDITVDNVGDVENEKDNCSTGIEATFVDAEPVAIEGCEGGFTIARTWSLKDNCGNSAEDQIQTITIRDNTVPTFTRPDDITIYTDEDCKYDITVDNVGDVENEKDNCSTGIEATFVDAEPVAIEGCEGGFTIARTWSLKDKCGNSAEDQIQKITIRDNTVPTFTRPADITIYTDEDCKYDITVDNVGDVENEKDNCSTGIEATFVDAEPVAIEGCEGGFTIARTWSLKDNCGNSAEDQIQTITIRDNTVPTFTRPADITIYTDEDCKYDITVDNVGDVENEKDNCSTGIEATFVDAEPVAIEGCEGGFTIARTWSLKDNCGNSAEDQIQMITIRDNTVPTFTRPDDITIYTDEDCKYDITVDNVGDVENEKDNCSTGIEATFVDAEPVAIEGCEGGFTIERTWSLIDNCGNSAKDQIQTITIRDNTVPTFTLPADMTIYTDEDCNYDISVGHVGDVENEKDNCSENIEATFKDATPVAIEGCEGGFTIERTWSLKDNCGNSAKDQIQTITIRDNTVPTFTRPADMTIYTDIDCNYDITVGHVGDVENEKDNCSQNIEATFKDATPVAIESCEGGFTIERTWSLKDNCGNSAKDQIQTITIRDNIIPVVNCAKDITIQCNDSSDPLNTGMTTATDNCDTDPSITYKDVLTPVEKGYMITRTWSVEDACGNSTSCDQIITIIDCEVDIDDPCTCVNNASPIDLDTGLGGDDGQFSELVAVTGPGGSPIPFNPLITFKVLTITGGVDAFVPTPVAPAQTPGNPILVGTDLVYNNTTGHYELPFYHYDAIGYTISVQQIVNGMPGQILGPVSNNCAYPNPSFSIPDEVCPNATALDLLAIDDPVTGGSGIFTIDGIVATEFDPAALSLGSHTVLLTYTGNADANGGIAPSGGAAYPGCTQEVQKVILVQDIIDPEITCPADLTIDCTASTDPSNTGMATATDNCDPDPMITSSDVVTPGSCPQEMIITRTWTATDANGGSTSCDQVITVDDSTPPVITGPDDFTVCIDYCEETAIVEFELPTATDDCNVGAVVVINESGINSGDMLAPGVYPLLFSATDDCGNRAEFIFTITVIETPPLVCSADATTTLDGETCSVTITAHDLLLGKPVGGTENLLITYELVEAFHVHDPTDVSGMGMGEITVTVPGKYKYSIECKNGADECWNYFTVEDKSNPICELAGDDEPMTTICGVENQPDPSGKDDLATEIVSCVVLEVYGEEALEPWFDKLELFDDPLTGEESDFSDCSDLKDIFMTTASREVDCNDDTNWGVTIPTGWRVCKVYTRVWQVSDWTGRRSEPCSQNVLIVSPIANTDNIIIDPKIEASCSASVDEIPSGAPYFIDLDNSLGDMVTCPQTSNQKIEIPAGSSICKISTIMDMYDPTEICGDGTEDCSSAYKKVIRWTVLDECSDKPIYYDFLQLLEVYDREGPTIMDKQAWITPNPFDCTSKLNASFAATDDCSEVTRYEINVSYNMPIGHLFGGGLVSRTYPGSTLELDDIPNGVEVTVTFIAYDCCDNPSDMSVMVTTMDKSDPVCVADDELIVSLVKLDYHDNDDLLVHAVGARVDAAAVNEGSQDNCFDLGYEIRQVDSDGNVIQDFAAYLDFIYTDAEGILDGCQRMEWVDLKVYEDRNSNGQHDEDERYSICPSKITFTDRTEPMASGDECFKYDCTGHSPDIAPPTILWDPSECASIDLVSDETEPFHCPELVECNGEMIYAMSKRTIIHRLTKNTDHTSFSKDITQVVYEELVEDVEIKMPWDLKVDCNQEFDPGTVLIDNQGCSEWSMSGPTIKEYSQGGASASVCGTITYEYQFLNFCKMERWERVNNLTVDRNASSQLINRSDFDNDGDGKILNNGIDDQVVIDETSDALADGFFRYIQIIKVIDNEAPTATVRDTSYCDLSNDCFGGVALFEVTPMDDCSTSEVTEWYINEDDNNFFGFERTGNVFESTSLSKGIYELHYKVEDQCGNSVWLVATTEVMWDDCKKPTIICHGALAPVMENGMLMITASSLVTSLTDNCSSEEFLSDNLLVFVPTDTNNDGDINEDDFDAAIQSGEGEEMVTLTCQRFGYVTVPVVVWTIDKEGNYQYCMTLVDLQRGTSDPCGAEPEGRVAGEIVNASDEMIGDVTVNVWSSILESFADLFDGFFNFSAPMSSDASVEPKKDIGYLNGVSTADLVLMQKHILGIAELSSSYQMIAADVSGDNKINTRDMLHLSKLILGIYDELPNVDSWKFVPKDYQFANPTSPWGYPQQINLENLSSEERADFVGIKMGDLSGNARPNSLLGDEIEPSEFLNVEILDARLVPNEVYPITFYAKSDINISGYQFTISLDSDVTLVSVEPGTLPNMDDSNFGKHKMEKGVLTTYWAHDQAIPMNGDEVLFTINVMAQQAVNLSDVLSINSSETKAEAYDDHLNILGMNLLNNKADKARLVLYQNNPNPFSDVTTIGFELPASDDITLLVRDIAGRTIKSISRNYPKGYNEIQLNSSDLRSIRGVLYYELRTSFGAPSKKMIIVE